MGYGKSGLKQESGYRYPLLTGYRSLRGLGEEPSSPPQEIAQSSLWERFKGGVYQVFVSMGHWMYGPELRVKLNDSGSNILKNKPKSSTGIYYFNPYRPSLGWSKKSDLKRGVFQYHDVQSVILKSVLLHGENQDEWKKLTEQQRSDAWTFFIRKIKEVLGGTLTFPEFPEPKEDGSGSVEHSMSKANADDLWKNAAELDGYVADAWSMVSATYPTGKEPPFLFVLLSSDAALLNQDLYDLAKDVNNALDGAADFAKDMTKEALRQTAKATKGILGWMLEVVREFWPWALGTLVVLVGVPYAVKHGPDFVAKIRAIPSSSVSSKKKKSSK